MDHWQLAYLGVRQIPRELSEFELATFFTFSAKERALIDARRSHLYRLACAVHIGFVRMTGRTLDAYKQVPKFLWAFVGAQLGITPPDRAGKRAASPLLPPQRTARATFTAYGSGTAKVSLSIPVLPDCASPSQTSYR
ncbi:DUF4158 domain-containing protein (plasmid) [Cupriavidus sp. Agwp_2]